MESDDAGGCHALRGFFRGVCPCNRAVRVKTQVQFAVRDRRGRSDGESLPVRHRRPAAFMQSG